MTSEVYSFKIDSLRTGLYAGAIDDLSSRLIGQATWNIGMTSAYQDFAPPSTLTVQLDNTDGAFNLDVNGDIIQSPPIFGPLIYAAGGFSDNIGTPVIGTTYRIIFNVTASSDSTGYVALYDGATRVSYPIHSRGSYQFFVNATSTDFSIKSFGSLNMTVDDAQVYFTTQYGPLITEGMLGKLRLTTMGKDVFIGKLTSFDLVVGSIGRRVATLTFTDYMYDLLDKEIIAPLYTNITAGAVIDNLFATGAMPMPYASSYWLLGIQGCSELDISTTLYNETSGITTETGSSTYAYVGDNSMDNDKGVSMQSLLRDVVSGEIYGRFFWDSYNNTFAFQDRSHDYLLTGGASVFTMLDTDYEVEGSVYHRFPVTNQSTITYEPRATGTPASIIWNSATFIGLYAEKKTITARYRDLSNPSARIGAIDVIPLEAGTDYTITIAGPGTDVTGDVPITMVVGANSAEITIDNSMHGYAIHVNALQIRGTPLTTFDSRSLVSQNYDSWRDFKLAPETVSYKLIDTDIQAQAIVEDRVNKFSDPQFVYDKISFIANKSTKRMNFIRDGNIGTRITITNIWQGHTAKYIIVGIRHTVTWGGEHTHQVVFQLKPADYENAWIMGTSHLGLDTVLVF